MICVLTKSKGGLGTGRGQGSEVMGVKAKTRGVNLRTCRFAQALPNTSGRNEVRRLKKITKLSVCCMYGARN